MLAVIDVCLDFTAAAFYFIVPVFHEVERKGNGVRYMETASVVIFRDGEYRGFPAASEYFHLDGIEIDKADSQGIIFHDSIQSFGAQLFFQLGGGAARGGYDSVRVNL